MEKITWTVSGGGAQASAPPIQTQQMEYVPTMRNTANSTSAEKESVRIWNLMVSTLRDNGLMKEKDN